MKPKLLLTFMVPIFLLAGSAHARLGLTREQCDLYYKSAGQQYSWGPRMKWFEYKLGAFTIDIGFLKEKAVSISYANHTGALSDEMVTILLETGDISRADLKEDFALEKAQFDANHPKSTLWTSPRYPGVVVSLIPGKSGYDLVLVTTKESREAMETK
jgi:hypothetical protein